MARYAACLFVALLLADLSVAQSPDHVEVFGGYAYLNSDFTSSVTNGVSGWNVSATVRVFRNAGIVADFSGFSPTGTGGVGDNNAPFATYHMFLGGPQASFTFGRIKPFARFLIGETTGSYTHADSQFGGDFSYFTYGLGGGADIGLNRWFAIRGNVDWLHIGSFFPSNVARVSTGLVFRF